MDVKYDDEPRVAEGGDVPVTAGPVAMSQRSDPPRRVEVVRDAPAKALADTSIMATSGEDLGALFGALAAAQGEFGEIAKTMRAKVESRRTGGVFEYAYETLDDVLDAVRPALSKNGLALMQFPLTRAASVVVRTLLGHKSGQWICNDLVASIADTSPQSIGGGISYLRRYAVKAMVGVSASIDDDDGAAASAPPQAAPRKSAAAASPRGTVKSIDQKGDGVVVALVSGFQAATRDTAIIEALRTLSQTHQTVELVTRASSDPSKYLPVVVEVMAVQADGPGS